VISISHEDSSRSSVRANRSESFPCAGASSWRSALTSAEPLEFVERRPEPDDYLLYPEKRTPDRRVYWADPKKPCASNTVHRWWYRMLEQAGLVGHGVRSGLNMHRARHTFATELRHVAGVEAASQALGHSDLATTLGIYGHQDQRDLERAMEAFVAAREAEEAASRGNDSPSRLD
jgi:integrase